MPPALLRSGPYRFCFVSHDLHEPAHVHIERDAYSASVERIYSEAINRCLTMKAELAGQMPENSWVALMAAGASSRGIRA